MYTIKAVAEATGIPPATLRAWERRYAVVRPPRSPTGYRLYDESLIQDLRVMRELVAVGHPASEAARIVAGRRQDVAAASPSPPISELIAAARAADPAVISAAVAAGLAAPGSLRADRRLLACWAQPTWQLSELLTDWQRRSVLGQRSSP